MSNHTWVPCEVNIVHRALHSSDAFLMDIYHLCSEQLQPLFFAPGDELSISYVSSDMKAGIAQNSASGTVGVVPLASLTAALIDNESSHDNWISNDSLPPVTDAFSSGNLESSASSINLLRNSQSVEKPDSDASQIAEPKRKKMRNRQVDLRFAKDDCRYEAKRKEMNIRGHGINLIEAQKQRFQEPYNYHLGDLINNFCSNFNSDTRPVFKVQALDIVKKRLAKLESSKVWRVWLKEEAWSKFNFIKYQSCLRNVTNAQLVELLLLYSEKKDEILNLETWRDGEDALFKTLSVDELLGEFWDVSAKKFNAEKLGSSEKEFVDKTLQEFKSNVDSSSVPSTSTTLSLESSLRIPPSIVTRDFDSSITQGSIPIPSYTSNGDSNSPGTMETEVARPDFNIQKKTLENSSSKTVATESRRSIDAIARRPIRQGSSEDKKPNYQSFSNDARIVLIYAIAMEIYNSTSNNLLIAEFSKFLQEVVRNDWISSDSVLKW